MTFRRGATLPTSTTLGVADTSDQEPTPGNGFATRWADDLAVLHEIGLTDVRLTLDWARLQPRPGALDRDWVERFDDIIRTASAAGLQTWIALHDGPIPQWLDNEGGLDDAETFATWWPRWVERAAETFGDHVHGWVPFALIPAGAAQPWRDTWSILGGAQPVVASIGGLDGLDRTDAVIGRMDVLGITLASSTVDGEPPTTRDIDEAAERWGTLLRAAADVDDRRDLCATIVTDGVTDPVAHAAAVELAVATIDDAIDDGARVATALLEPAIAGPGSAIGLLDVDRTPTPALAAFRPIA